MTLRKHSVYPLDAGQWFKLKYTLTEVDGEKYFIALQNSEPIDYNPLENTPPKSRTKRKEDQRWSPHIHLANINLEDELDICTFVNKWGILGVRKNHKKNPFQEWLDKWGYALEPKSKVELERIIWAETDNEDSIGLSFPLVDYQEPLKDFIKAAKEYQLVFTKIDEGKVENYNGYSGEDLINEKRRRFDLLCEAAVIINQHLGKFHPWLHPVSKDEKALNFQDWSDSWLTSSTSSLLDFCYLLTWMDLTMQQKYKRCKREKCKQFFLKKRSDQEFCSDECKDTHKSFTKYIPVKERKLSVNKEDY